VVSRLSRRFGKSRRENMWAVVTKGGKEGRAIELKVRRSFGAKSGSYTYFRNKEHYKANRIRGRWVQKE